MRMHAKKSIDNFGIQRTALFVTTIAMINEFVGKFRFLSNFYPSEIQLGTVKYSTVEHAYQASKTNDLKPSLLIAYASSPAKAKAMGKKVELREDWPAVKVSIMRQLLELKFAIPSLREMLLLTQDQELKEGNYWHDQFWGSCCCPLHIKTEGQNMLGKLLMEIRKDIHHGSNPSSNVEGTER